MLRNPPHILLKAESEAADTLATKQSQGELNQTKAAIVPRSRSNIHQID